MEANRQIAALLAASEPVTIGKWTFHADSLLLECGDNSVKLEPRVAYLLYFLAENAGVPVSRAELTDRVWSGTVVGDEALTTAINKLRNAFGDESHHPKVIKTIPKVGYQLIADVVFTESIKAEAKPGTTANKKLAYAGYAMIGLLVIAGTLLLTQGMEPNEKLPPLETPDNPIIAVLPFDNMSSDPDQDYLSDGISEDIITDLSQLKNLSVIARNSSFAYRDKSLNVQDIGKDLGAKYLLEGSVRKSGNQLRITAQLIDAATGHHLWADRYDRELTEIFALQDEITDRIVTALSIKLSDDELQRLSQKATNNFEAYDLTLQARIFTATSTKEGYARASEIYRRAIMLDPGYARAYGLLSVALTRQSRLGYSDAPGETLDRAFELAQKAVSIDPDSPQVQWALGYVYMYKNQFTEAVDALERAVSLSPSYADGYALLALIKNEQGYAEEAIRLVEKGIDLNPNYSWDYLYNLGRAHYALGHYQKANQYLQQSLERNEAVVSPRIFLIANFVKLDQLDDAEWEIIQLQSGHPEINLSNVIQVLPLIDEELRSNVLADLRTAGMTE